MSSSKPSLYVYIPTRHPQSIAPGSAVVSLQSPGSYEQIEIDYEEPHLVAAPADQFADRVEIASHQHLSNYPTATRVVFSTSHLILAGIYDPTRGVVAPFGPASEALIARWCGATSIAQVALTRSASPALPAPEQWEALTRSLAAQPAPVLS